MLRRRWREMASCLPAVNSCWLITSTHAYLFLYKWHVNVFFFFSFAASVFLTQHEIQRFYSCTTATDRLGKIAHAPQRHFMLNLYKNPPDYQCNGSSSHLALLWMMGNHRHRFSEQILATIYLLPWILLDALWSLATAVMATSMHTWGVKM